MFHGLKCDCFFRRSFVPLGSPACGSACEKVWILNLQTAGRFSAAKSELSDCEIRSLDPCLVKFVFEALKATCVAGSFWNSSGGGSISGWEPSTPPANASLVAVWSLVGEGRAWFHVLY